MMQRESLSLDWGWRFRLGEVPDKKYMGHDALYTATKAASSKGLGRRDFDDSGWRKGDLPHDYECYPSTHNPLTKRRLS